MRTCVSVRIVCKYASTHSMQVHSKRTCILCSLHTYNAGSDPIQPNTSEPLYKFPQVFMSIMYITMLGRLQVSVHANMHICPFVFKHNNHHDHRCVSLCVCVSVSVCALKPAGHLQVQSIQFSRFRRKPGYQSDIV